MNGDTAGGEEKVILAESTNAESMLAPYRVIDISDEKGHYCGQLLGSLGADVIKVESPGGDPLRKRGPFFHDIPDKEKSLPWLALNSNKRGITLNIETRQGQDIFKRLARVSDVVIESFTPSYMDELGVGYAQLERINPELVMASVTPFGQSGPHRNYKGSDLICWAMGGLLSQSGDTDRPPVRVSHINLAYLIASMDAAWGILMAILWRDGAKQGQHVDVSIQESIAKSTFLTHEYYEVTGAERQRCSSFYHVPWTDLTLRTVWPTKDGSLYFMIHGGEFGSRENPIFVEWMEEEGIADDYIRGINWRELDWRDKTQDEIDRIQDYFHRLFSIRTRAEITEEAYQRHIVLQPINSPRDILENPQLKARNYWDAIPYDNLGETLIYPSRFFLSSETRCQIERRAPLIGEHNEDIYFAELGISREELAALRRDGII